MIDEKQTPLTLSPHADVNSLTVTRSKKLVASNIKLTLRQQKVLAACISQINPLEDYPNGITVELTDRDLSKLTGIKLQHIYEFISETALTFHSIPIMLPGKNPKDFSVINIAEVSNYCEERRVFTIKFHSLMQNELINLRRYSSPKLTVLNSFRSTYSLRLYDLLYSCYISRKGGTQYVTFELKDLHFTLGIIDSDDTVLVHSAHKRFADFRKQVLIPAIKGIEKFSPLIVEFEPIRVGRSVGRIKFSISTKPNIDLSETQTDILIQNLGFSEDKITRIKESYPEEVIDKNVLYLSNLLQKNESKIEKPAAYLEFLLKYNVAMLPDVANPYSEIYRSSDTLRTFVKDIIMPLWWRLSDSIREDIQYADHLLSYSPIFEYFTLYEANLKQTSHEETSAHFTSDIAYKWILSADINLDM